MVNKTRADVDLEATRVECPSTPFEGKQNEEERPLMGWLAITEGDHEGEAFHFYEGRNVIGSSPQCHMMISDEGIQSQHFGVRIDSKRWMLTDFDTDGGTFLNGKRVYRNELQDGDRIKIGKALLRIKKL